MKKTRFLSVLLVAAMLVLTLGGCSKKVRSIEGASKDNSWKDNSSNFDTFLKWWFTIIYGDNH